MSEMLWDSMRAVLGGDAVDSLSRANPGWFTAWDSVFSRKNSLGSPPVFGDPKSEAGVWVNSVYDIALNNTFRGGLAGESCGLFVSLWAMDGHRRCYVYDSLAVPKTHLGPYKLVWSGLLSSVESDLGLTLQLFGFPEVVQVFVVGAAESSWSFDTVRSVDELSNRAKLCSALAQFYDSDETMLDLAKFWGSVRRLLTTEQIKGLAVDVWSGLGQFETGLIRWSPTVSSFLAASSKMSLRVAPGYVLEVAEPGYLPREAVRLADRVSDNPELFIQLACDSPNLSLGEIAGVFESVF